MDSAVMRGLVPRISIEWALRVAREMT